MRKQSVEGANMWHEGLSAVPLPIGLPANAPGRAEDDDSSIWIPPMEFLAPGFNLVHSQTAAAIRGMYQR